MDMNHSHNKNLNSLMDKIRKVDFALVELNLYLDVYPHSREALNYYHKLVDKRDKLVAEYQRYAPLTAGGNTSTESWDWISSPWPWKYEAN